jgi:hypothetical protein
MKICRFTFLCVLCLGMSMRAQQAEKSQGINVRLEALKLKDLRRTAHRYRIGVDQLVNARTALSEATDLVLRQDAVSNDFGMLARLWLQLDRRKARAEIGNLIEMACRQALAAEDLNGYRQSTNMGLQLVASLSEIDPEKARKIAELWPEPASSLGDAGRQAFAQLQNDTVNRMSAMNSGVSNQNFEPYLDAQKSASLPLSPRVPMASSLISSNQRDKARALLDQAILDVGKIAAEPNKRGEVEMFLRNLASVYPERLLDAFESYRGAFVPDISNPGTIYESGDLKVLITQEESVTLSMLRGMYGRPELALKLLESSPSLRSKLNQLGGLDRVLNPSVLSGQPVLRSYPANSPPPQSPVSGVGYTLNGVVFSDGRTPSVATNPNELFMSLRGKAEYDPEYVRRKLADEFTKKEHFNLLINLAQMASGTDPDLGSVALDVARGLLAAFDTPQSKLNSLRMLITTERQVDGEVDPALIRQGFNFVSEMRDEETKREQVNRSPNPAPIRPSDDLEVFLISQTALDDFKEALRRARALDEEKVRIRALVQIAQTLMSYY